jgi:hypothetical protein
MACLARSSKSGTRSQIPAKANFLDRMGGADSERGSACSVVRLVLNGVEEVVIMAIPVAKTLSAQVIAVASAALSPRAVGRSNC